MTRIAIALITIYQIILSPILKVLLGADKFCRFEETCSQYSKRMIREHGVIKGLSLGLARLSKCQPFYSGNLTKEAI